MDTPTLLSVDARASIHTRQSERLHLKFSSSPNAHKKNRTRTRFTEMLILICSQDTKTFHKRAGCRPAVSLLARFLCASCAEKSRKESRLLAQTAASCRLRRLGSRGKIRPCAVLHFRGSIGHVPRRRRRRRLIKAAPVRARTCTHKHAHAASTWPVVSGFFSTFFFFISFPIK